MPDPFLAESPLYFSVSARAVSVADVGGEPQPAVAFQAIVRDDNGEVLGIHGRKIQAGAERAAVCGFDEALRRSGIDLSEMTVKDQVN